MLSRRLFIRHLMQGAIATSVASLGAARRGSAASLPASNTFHLAQLKYEGGMWDPRPRATISLVREVRQRTSVETRDERKVVTLQDPALFSFPFLYMTGEQSFPPLSDASLTILRRYLLFGGLLLIDDARGNKGRDFDASVRRDIARLFQRATSGQIKERASLAPMNLCASNPSRKEALMRNLKRGCIRQQLQFLQRQYLQGGELPLSKILCRSAVRSTLMAIPV